MKKGIAYFILIGIVTYFSTAVIAETLSDGLNTYIVQVSSARALEKIEKDLRIHLKSLVPPLFYTIEILDNSQKLFEKLREHPLVESIVKNTEVEILPNEEMFAETADVNSSTVAPSLPLASPPIEEFIEIDTAFINRPGIKWWQKNDGSLMCKRVQINKKSGEHKILSSFPSTIGADIHLEEAHAIEKGKPEIIVAVIDKGIDITHPTITNNVYTNPAETEGNGIDDDGNGLVDDIHGWNFTLKNRGLIDEIEHGTAVAGIIAGNSTEFQGVCPQCSILPISTKGNQKTTSNLLHIYNAFQYARAKKAKVINMSLVIRTSKFEDVKIEFANMPPEVLEAMREREELDVIQFNSLFQLFRSENIVID